MLAGYHFSTQDFEDIGRVLLLTVHEWHVAAQHPWRMAEVVENLASVQAAKKPGKVAAEGESDEEGLGSGNQDDDASSSDGSDADPTEGNLDALQLQARWKEFLEPKSIETPEPTIPREPL